MFEFDLNVLAFYKKQIVAIGLILVFILWKIIIKKKLDFKYWASAHTEMYISSVWGNTASTGMMGFSNPFN